MRRRREACARKAIPTPSVSGPVRALDQIEKDYIMAVLDLNGGNQTRTAEQLGIGSATLYRKLKSYGLVRATRAGGDGGLAHPETPEGRPDPGKR